MSYGFKVAVSGDYALFTRPELKVERVSYDFITPSAARGILEAVCWKPAIKYVVDKIHVLNPIKFTNIRRNEVSEKLSASKARSIMKENEGPLLYLAASENIQQRASLLLKDVSYIIEAHFEMTDKAGERDSPEKFYNMILRRLRNGQCYSQPYLGCREFPAKVSLFEDIEINTAYENEERNFGLMLYDMDFSDNQNIQPVFFRAEMKNGIVDLTDCEVYR